MLRKTKKTIVYECMEVGSTELSSSRRVTMATPQENAEQIHVHRYLTHELQHQTLQPNILKFICHTLKGDLHYTAHNL
jgi:hypothetical protein